jgi:hypothetical protein
MSEQIHETTVVANPELLSIDISDQYFLPEVNHMIVDKSYYPMINLPFPPIIKPMDLIVNKKSPQDSPNGKQIRAPNAFIIYRKAFVKAARDQGYILPMTVISSMASASWDQETITVKEEYKRIAKDAHKLIKEMFPKKSNQRKRKEKWNIVSFHDKDNKIIKNSDSNKTNSSENNSSKIISAQEPTTITSSSSSPNLSEFDDIDESQISNNYLMEELNTNIPNSFQEYLNSNFNFYLPEDQIEDYALEELELFGTTSTDDLKVNPQSSLNVTLSEVMKIIDSNNFDLKLES